MCCRVLLLFVGECLFTRLSGLGLVEQPRLAVIIFLPVVVVVVGFLLSARPVNSSTLFAFAYD